MEEAEDAAAGVRKRKRDGEFASVDAAGVVVLPLPGGEAALEGGGGCFAWKELEVEKEEGEGIAEASVEEVMRWLEAEISSSPSGKGGGDDGFVTINGNEESCGPSFSAAASTVMASVDTRAGAPPPPTPIPWPWPEPDSASDAQAMDLLDDDWLLDLLAAAGPALEVLGLDP